MDGSQKLRGLPSVDEVIRSDNVASAATAFPRPQVVRWAREAVEECRQMLRRGTLPEGATPLNVAVHGTLQRIAAERAGRQRRVINATGVLLHTNLGRAPLADRAIAALQAAARYASVELDLATGKRTSRGDRAARLLAELTGAQDALIVNNCAAATLLVLQTLAAGREAIVSRGQLIEIGGGFRLPEVFLAAGVILKEVGTTNRTYAADFAKAIGGLTGVILRVHRSNFRLTGFVAEPGIEELVQLGQQAGVPVVDDLGSGWVHESADSELREPGVATSIRAGADLVLFSGDKLFGGPQCGIIVGRRTLIERMRVHPLMRAVRVDKLILAALESTAEIHLSQDAFRELPILRMLSSTQDEIRARCRSARDRLIEVAGVPNEMIQILECESCVGGGSLPGTTLPSYGLCLEGPRDDSSVERLAEALRRGDPAILGRISDGRLWLDLRTLADDELNDLVAGLSAAIRSSASVGRDSESAGRNPESDTAPSPPLPRH